MKKPTLTQRVELMERARKQDFHKMSTAMMHGLEDYLSRRQMDAVYYEIHREMERIKREITDSLQYERITVDVKHTHVVNGKETE